MTEFRNSLQMGIFFSLLLLGAVLIAANQAVWGMLVLLYAFGGLRIIYDYERGIIFTLGKYSGVLAGGLVWIALGLQRLVKVDLRIRAVDIPMQEVITKDNVNVRINGVAFFRVEYPEKAVLNVQNYEQATVMYAQTVLRDVAGQYDLDTLLQKRDEIAEQVRRIVDEITDRWG